MSKKILVVDDSALMRRILCDIINADVRFQVADTAANGLEALNLLQTNTYDLIVLDLMMPGMDGISFLKEMNRLGNSTKVVVSSTLANEGADITVDALSLGAVDFVKKPDGILDARGEKFSNLLIRILTEVAFASERKKGKTESEKQKSERQKSERQKPVFGKFSVKGLKGNKGKNKIVAIASSTGGPKALQEVLPRLPEDLDAPVLVVQHMPAGFTATLAERLDSICPLRVQEAKDGMPVQKGNIYIARGGIHMTVVRSGGCERIAFLDDPPREGVKPCANYMYESLKDCDYERVVCAVLTGMGADGTEGIANLKKHKELYVIAQNQESCAVYGMPRSAVAAGLADEVVPLNQVAEAIIKNVGVRKDGC
ncbi:MAG: chemotaxis response regulator protein-glutamate methylesterase [Lachnospiraceae bacterium]